MNNSDENNANGIDANRRKVLIGGAGGLAAAYVGVGVTLASAAESQSGTVGGSIKQPNYIPEDKFFGPAFIDIDEWRESPVPHRYVHGGFKGTDTRFSLYFPPKEKYHGRFIHALEGGLGGNENSSALSSPEGVVPAASLGPAFEMGAYFVESNQGHFGADTSGVKGDATILCWRASAETAKFGKHFATSVYGVAPHHGYIYGGSGGGVRSLKCLEEVHGVWDGGVPFVMPHNSQGTFFSIQSNAIRVLGQERISALADATEVGGSGDLFAGLNNEQSQALATLYKSGFPRGVTLRNAFEAVLVWSWLAHEFDQNDPTYFADFWTKPGYLGHDNPAALEKDRVLVKTRVKRVLTSRELATYQSEIKVVDQFGIGEQSRIFAGPRRSPPDRAVALILESGNTEKMGCARIDFQTGAGKGRDLYVLGVLGDALVASGIGGEWLNGVKPGDEVVMDNSRYLAYCLHHRHQVEAEFAEWGHSVDDGQPIYLQRPLLKKIMSAPYNFNLPGKKIIVVCGLSDRGTWPSGVVSYREHLAKTMNVDAESLSRVWFNEHQQHIDGSLHVPEGLPVPTTQFIDYGGTVHEALRQVIEWIEHGKKPLASTQFEYSRDSKVIVAPNAVARHGIQPVVYVTGNGKRDRVEIKAGQPIEFEVVAEAPPGSGTITKVEWDFEGTGTWPVHFKEVDGRSIRVKLKTSYTFSKPGTYFPSCRVLAHHAGDVKAKFFNRPNLGRIRIVVT